MDRTDSFGDIQLRNAQLIGLMFLLEKVSSILDVCYRTVEPVVYNLHQNQTWDKVDLEMACRVCGHVMNFAALESFSDRALGEAKKLGDIGCTLAIYINSLARLTSIRHYEAINSPLESNTNLGEVTNLFNRYLKEANKICDEGNFPIFKALLLGREGIFYKDFSKVNDSVTTLISLDRVKRAETLILEVSNLFSIKLNL